MKALSSLVSPGAFLLGFEVVRSDVSLHGLSPEHIQGARPSSQSCPRTLACNTERDYYDGFKPPSVCHFVTSSVPKERIVERNTQSSCMGGPHPRSLFHF